MNKKNFSLLKEIVPKKYFFLYLLAALTQQIIVALSTYISVKIAQCFGQGHHCPVEYFYLLFGALFLNYVPGRYAFKQMNLTIISLYSNYIKNFGKKLYGNIYLSTHKDYANRYKAVASQESYLVFFDFLNYVKFFIDISLNIAFNLLVVGLLISMDLMWFYALGSIGSYVFIRYMSKRIKESSEKDQNARIILQEHMTSFLDSKSFANAGNNNEWDIKFDDSIEKYLRAKTSENNNQSISTHGSIAIMLSTVLIGFTQLMHSANLSTAIALAFTITRQILIAQYLQEIFTFSTLAYSHITKLAGIIEPLTSIPDIRKEVLNRIQWDNIEIEGLNHKKHADIKKLTLDVQSSDPHMITITGPNGCGKSSLLQVLKESLGEAAYYLPAHHDLYFQEKCGGSTGEKLLHNLAYIFNNYAPKYLLLDEWDANLSKKNTELMEHHFNKYIEEHGATIIQVRHYKTHRA